MGFSGGSQSSTQNTSPWEGQQPYLRDIFQQSQNLYRQGGPEFYDQQTVAPFSDVTQAGMGAQAARGATGSRSEMDLNNYINRTINGPGVDVSGVANAAGAQTQTGMEGAGILRDAANPMNYFNQGSAAALDPSRVNGYFNAVGQGPAYAQSAVSGAANGQSLPTASNFAFNGGGTERSAVEATARGDYLNANPYLNDMFASASDAVTEQFNDTVMPGINATFGGAGRTGSALHQQAVNDAGDDLARNLTNMSADIYGSNYATERGRQMDAASVGLGDDVTRRSLATDLYSSDADRSLSAGAVGLNDDLARTSTSFDNMFRQQGSELDYFGNAASRALSAGDSLYSGLGTGTSNLTNLYSTQAGARQGAASLVSDASGLDYQNIDRMLATGQITDEQAQRLIDADRERYDYQQNLPWANLINYANIVNQNPFTQSSGGSRGMNVGLEF